MSGVSPQIYAIDYGTSNSLINAATPRNIWYEIPIDPYSLDKSVLKSMIYCLENDDWAFGQDAINRYLAQPTLGRIFKSLKRFLPDPSFQGTRIFGEMLSLQDLIAKQLRFMRMRANEYFQADVTQVVLGCPALFSENIEYHELAINRLTAAAKASGFHTIEFCPEPIAAAYKFRHTLDSEKLVLVADFGGGTSDFTVVKMDRNRFDPSDVLALGGISIAGDKFDADIMRTEICPFLGSKVQYKKPMGRNILSFPKGLIKKMCNPADIVFLNSNATKEFLRDARRYLIDPSQEIFLEHLELVIEDFLGYAIFSEIEKTKIDLSETQDSTFSFSYSTIDIKKNITQQSFRDSSQEHTQKIINCLDEVLSNAQVSAQDIDIVCLTGGTASVPSIHEGLINRFGEKIKLSHKFHSVVHGLIDRAQNLLRD